MPAITKAEDIEIDYIQQQSHGKFFDDYVPKKIHSRAYEAVRVSTDGLSLKLVDKNQRDLLSCVNGVFTSYNEIEYFEITGTYSKIEQRGYLTYLFEILIYELNYRVLSDSMHSSPGSKEFWQAQMRRKNFSIYRLNIKTNHKRKANRFKEEEIWGPPRKKSFNISSFNYKDDSGDDYEFDEFDITDSEEADLEEILTADDFIYDDAESQFSTASTAFEDIRLIAQIWKEK